jgi:hypothetical protein
MSVRVSLCGVVRAPPCPTPHGPIADWLTACCAVCCVCAQICPRESPDVGGWGTRHAHARAGASTCSIIHRHLQQSLPRTAPALAPQPMPVPSLASRKGGHSLASGTTTTRQCFLGRMRQMSRAAGLYKFGQGAAACHTCDLCTLFPISCMLFIQRGSIWYI